MNGADKNDFLLLSNLDVQQQTKVYVDLSSFGICQVNLNKSLGNI